jgi:cytochrome c oxidase assembly protein subunit 15
MPKTKNRAVMIWLFIFAFVVAFLVVWGGYTRLTRSGLSIVEWNPISGTIPPLGEKAWQDEFLKYQETPEYIHVNSSMTLDEYKFIFFIEWFHRFIARAAGLIYAIPVFFFLFTKRIPWKEFGVYFVMGMLFISQAFAGWYMVASGLVDRPAVSHYLLTVHLFLALSLLGFSFWTAVGHLRGFPQGGAKFSLPSKLAVVSFILLLIQIAYGGLTAGLKAGHVSNTWPLMFGQLVPRGLLSALEPWALNLVETPQTVAFIHRWFAFAVLGLAVSVYFTANRLKVSNEARKAALLLAGLIGVQVLFGIGVVLFNVQLEVALFHQAMAILLFAAALYLIHSTRRADG